MSRHDKRPGPVIHARLAELAAQVRDADRTVRDDGPDGVHELRVAMRRLRSLLRTFRPLLDPDSVPAAERLRAELRWAGGELSTVRDLEVMQGELSIASADESLPPSVEARLERFRDEADNAARRQMADLLASDRYARMLEDLGVGGGDWEAVTRHAVRDRLRSDFRRLRRRARAAEAPGADPEVALHEVRKAAKRARYAAEMLAPVLGGRALRMAAVAERVQDALGTHRDTLLARDLLHRLASEPAADEEHTFALGRLHAQEERRGQESLYDYARVRLELDRARYRR